MAQYDVSFKASPNHRKFVGTYEARSKKEAIEKAKPKARTESKWHKRVHYEADLYKK